MYAYVPNALTISRIPLAGGFLLAHIYYTLWYIALGMLVTACITDWLDGKLARRWGVVSPFGKLLDPYADKAICWAVTFVVIYADATIAIPKPMNPP